MITQEFLKSIFDYKDGDLYWKNKTSSNVVVGKKAGGQRQDGYVRISMKGKDIYAHRLIWLWHYGFLPECLDHINGVRNDNRIENLRAATPSQNMMNRQKYKNNASGVIGVRWKKSIKRWVAFIGLQGKNKHIGCFENFDDAIAARKKAEKLYFGEFAREPQC